MISVVDYGLGNVQAFLTMYKRLGVEARPVRSAKELGEAQKIILPGVGSFDHAMNLLNESGMKEELDELVLQRKVPVLGVCVGMQMFADSSEEGEAKGLGWISGCVKRFSDSLLASKCLPMPHMGWNDVLPVDTNTLFRGFSEEMRFYFLHSYYYDCENLQHVCATAEYGFDFHCAVQNNNIYGVQFHPEKSHHWGAMLLKNFAEL